MTTEDRQVKLRDAERKLPLGSPLLSTQIKLRAAKHKKDNPTRPKSNIQSVDVSGVVPVGSTAAGAPPSINPDKPRQISDKRYKAITTVPNQKRDKPKGRSKADTIEEMMVKWKAKEK